MQEAVQKPILHVFLISHYCEKARWALDLAGVDYQVNLLSPLQHAKTAKAIGASGSALPILQIQSAENGRSQIIQGSADIVVWANQQATINAKRGLTISAESNEIEKRLDDILGVHVRRWFYSESLLDCPQTIRPVFAEGSGFLSHMMLRLAWPKVVTTMIKRMDLGRQQETQSRDIVAEQLDWLDSLLAGERQFLVGESLSNADIAAASLIAPLFSPAKHPAFNIVMLPPRAAATAEQWKSRPVAKWLTELYREVR
ncbi:MAG: glutathione S-transferase N-terminal domain-containing protein [Arenicella sp.]|nr:glutathione S-transferase N-terminal domain-containing protein [Arenicella sp.]